MHGICFQSLWGTQKPGSNWRGPSQKKVSPVAAYTKWIRTSYTQGNEIIELAKEYGFKTLVGAWLGEDLQKNEQEISALVDLAKAGYVDVAGVGNEVMYRKELEEEVLIAYIDSVKDQLPEVPVGYVDAYYEFTNRPKITQACDVILANCYPYWEGCGIDYSLLHEANVLSSPASRSR